VAFDRDTTEAELSLDLIGSSAMPKIAWDALEAGLDGPGIRRLAALDSPTYFEVRGVVPRAMQEMGLATVARSVAALRIAKHRAQEILASGGDPLRHIHDFEHLWITAGYPSELCSVGTVCDDVYIASGNQSDDAIRKWIVERLKEMIRQEERR
jgi:hypothetical protein